MKKLKLQVEALIIESFSTHAVPPLQGTVLAHSGGSCNTYDQHTCEQYNSCGAQFTCRHGGSTCGGGQTCGPNEPVVDWLNDDPRQETDCCTMGCP